MDDVEGVELKFVFHLVCCGGKGVNSFITQVLYAYDDLLAKEKRLVEPSMNAADIALRSFELPNKRRLFEWLWKSFVVRPKRFLTATFKKSASIRFDYKNAARASFYSEPPRQSSLSLDVETTLRLGQFAKSQKTTTSNG